MSDTRDIIQDIDALLSGDISGPEQGKAVLREARAALAAMGEAEPFDRQDLIDKMCCAFDRRGIDDPYQLAEVIDAFVDAKIAAAIRGKG